jgi:hypothetical protein
MAVGKAWRLSFAAPVQRTLPLQALRTLSMQQVLCMLVQLALRKLGPQVLRMLVQLALRKLGPQVLRMLGPRVPHTLRPVESRELRKSHWLLALRKPCSFESWELKELKSSQLAEQLALHMWIEQRTSPALAKHTLVAHLPSRRTPLWIRHRHDSGQAC